MYVSWFRESSRLIIDMFPILIMSAFYSRLIEELKIDSERVWR